MTTWLPVCASPWGIHRQGGGVMSTTMFSAPGEEFLPPKWIMCSIRISQLLPVEHLTDELPSAAPAGRAGMAAASAGSRTATPATMALRLTERGRGAERGDLTACTP